MAKATDLGRCIASELNDALDKMGVAHDDRDRVTAVLVRFVTEVARKHNHGHRLVDTANHRFHSGFNHYEVETNHLDRYFDPMGFGFRDDAVSEAGRLNEKSAHAWAEFIQD